MFLPSQYVNHLFGCLDSRLGITMSRKDLAREIIEDIVAIARKLGHIPTMAEYVISGGKFRWRQTELAFGSWTMALKAAGLTTYKQQVKDEARDPKILVFDIETAPLLGYVWSIWEQNIGLNQIKHDWFILSWAAKWLDKQPVIQMDQEKAKDMEDDKAILKPLWELLNEADCVITQNGKAFDSKKVNARFAINGMGPPSPYRHIDTKALAKKSFGFTSNKLEYLSDKLCTKKKSKHHEFEGFELWKECLNRNPKAWKVMREYNCQDVLATEELYKKLRPWGIGINMNVLHGDAVHKCICGSQDLIKKGFKFTQAGKFQQFQCRACGSWTANTGQGNNLLSLKKRMSLKNIKD